MENIKIIIATLGMVNGFTLRVHSTKHTSVVVNWTCNISLSEGEFLFSAHAFGEQISEIISFYRIEQMIKSAGQDFATANALTQSMIVVNVLKNFLADKL